jgi:hypothetical protein
MSKFTRLAVLCVSMVFPCLAAAAGFAVDRPVAQDTPASTVAGNPFTVPAGWSVSVKGAATIITPPESGSHIVYVDVEAEDAESAIAKAWAVYKEPRWPLKLVDEQADDNGWSRRKRFEYQTSPNERRGVAAGAMFANGAVDRLDLRCGGRGRRQAQRRDQPDVREPSAEGLRARVVRGHESARAG